MAHGLKAVGDSGVLQIDESYSNLALKQRGSVWVAATPHGGTGGTITVYGLNTPLMCVSTPSGNSVVVWVTNKGADWVEYRFTSSFGATVNWYVFDQTTPVSSGMGLTVYRSDGQPAYSSSWKVLRLASVVGVPNLTANGDYPAATAAAPYGGATWAACLTTYRASLRDFGPVGEIWTDGIVTNSGGAYTDPVRYGQLQTDGSYSQNMQPYGGSILLVDVTNY